MARQYRSRSVGVWLLLVIAMVYGMILVGGLTRLTNSGLSMVDWKPIMGAIPPLTLEDWQKTFDAYKSYPEYLLVNQGMTLDEFKSIFYWEYGHRVLGRVIGIAFFLPFVFFLVRGKLKAGIAGKLFVAFVLGGAQGLLGWYMVKSGLVNEPRVSQYRLAAHLGLAFALLSYLYWIFLEISLRVRARIKEPSFKIVSLLVLAIISIQIFYGALTAGLDAGLVYNTFPDMNGNIVPPGLTHQKPMWKNFFENAVAVQFIHRCLAWLTLGVVLLQFIWGWRCKVTGQQRWLQAALLLMTLLQFALGVGTLLLKVPVSVASLHQAGAAVLLILAVTNCFIEWRLLKDRVGAFA